MGLDYYSILDVPRDSTTIEIKLAYRKWAPLCHPGRKKIKCDIEHEFREINFEERPCSALSDECYWCFLHEAYDVLSNPLYREVYDLHGEEGLKKGVPTKWGFFHPYKFNGNCEKIYREFFASYSPFADIIDAVTNPPPLACSADGRLLKKEKDIDIEHMLQITLEEVYKGGIKKMKIMRQEFVNEMKGITQIKERWLKIPIKPGIASGTTIRFPGEGDQGPSRIPADIVFIIKVKEHEKFRRSKQNLHMTQVISLKEALCGFSFNISTLDDRNLTIKVTDIVCPTYCTTLEGEGLPEYEIPEKFGNLYIDYQIRFPLYVPKKIKTQLSDLFDEMEDNDDDNTKMNKVAKYILNKKMNNGY